MEELKQQIAVLMDKSYGPERHRLHRIMEQLPEMAEVEISRVSRDIRRWEWEVAVRGAIWQMVAQYLYENDEYPYAIMVGGEAFGAIYCDKDAQIRCDGGFLWRGILVVRSTDRNTAYLISKATPVPLPMYPGE